MAFSSLRVVSNTKSDNKPAKRCVKSYQSSGSPVQPSVLALLRAPATQTVPRGDDAQTLDYSAELTLTFGSPVTQRSALGNPASFKYPSVREVKAFQCLCSPEDEFGEAGVQRAARRAVNPGDHLKGARAASSLYREKKILSTGSPV